MNHFESPFFQIIETDVFNHRLIFTPLSRSKKKGLWACKCRLNNKLILHFINDNHCETCNSKQVDCIELIRPE